MSTGAHGEPKRREHLFIIVSASAVRGAILHSQGRSTATDLVSSCLCVAYLADDGTTWHAVPKSLLQRSKAQGGPRFTPRALEPMAMDTFVKMVAVLTANNDAEQANALVAAGIAQRCGPRTRICDWVSAVRLLTQWCYVAVGPHARKWWVPHWAGDALNDHCDCLCHLCEEQQVHGPCEHGYAALISQGVLPAADITGDCDDDERGWRRAPLLPSPASLVPAGASGTLRAPPTPPAAGHPQPRPDTGGLDDLLVQILRRLGLASPQRLAAVRANEVTSATVAGADLASLCSCLALTFGGAERLQRAIRQAADGSFMSRISWRTSNL